MTNNNSKKNINEKKNSNDEKKYNKKKNTKKFRKLNCAPGISNEISCYSKNNLENLKLLWNSNHPDDLITSKNYKELWESLKYKFSNVCNHELCWINNKLLKEKIDKRILKHRFAPFHPTSWNIDKNTWLSSSDIIKVLKGYETLYPNFNFIGPSPIDFDKKLESNICVYNDLCNIEIKKFLKKNIDKIGFIFNTDPHYKSGSHWIALFLDIPKNIIFFFDSTGDPIPNQVKKLCNRIIEQGKELDIKLKYDDNLNHNHQKSNTECGVFCLYFIISLLTEKHNTNYFKTKNINDDYIEKFRKIYFNQPELIIN